MNIKEELKLGIKLHNYQIFHVHVMASNLKVTPPSVIGVLRGGCPSFQLAGD